MVWVKECEKVYKKAGFKKPVFLCDNMQKKRFFVDVPKGVQVEIQYSYDTPKVKTFRAEKIQWHSYEAGLLESDFAFEMIGITALRLHILTGNLPEDFTPVKLEIYEKSEMKEA
tara:strand:- start:170629 stop:170970 length:342 start_codon:yes stop_codon:yes gene_type:complete